jgi:hypothetical protein
MSWIAPLMPSSAIVAILALTTWQLPAAATSMLRRAPPPAVPRHSPESQSAIAAPIAPSIFIVSSSVLLMFAISFLASFDLHARLG